MATLASTKGSSQSNTASNVTFHCLVDSYPWHPRKFLALEFFHQIRSSGGRSLIYFGKNLRAANPPPTPPTKILKHTYVHFNNTIQHIHLMMRILYYASIVVTIITTGTHASQRFTISYDSSSSKPEDPKSSSLQPKKSAQKTVLVDDSLLTRGPDLDLAWSPLSPLSDTDSRGSSGSSLEPEDTREGVRIGGRPRGGQSSTAQSKAFRLKSSQHPTTSSLHPISSQSPSQSSISTDNEGILDSPLAEEVLDPISRKSDMPDAPTSESLEAGTIDLSFHDSLFNIIKALDRTFIPALNVKAFSKYVSGADVLGILTDKNKRGHHLSVIDKMLDTVGQMPGGSARKSIREAVAKWIDLGYSLQVANLVRVNLSKGVSRSPRDLEAMFNQFRDDPFSVDHHRIDSYAYVEIHKYTALFLKKLIVHLRDERTRFDALVKQRGLPPKSKFASFKDFMMRDILLLWDFLDNTSFTSTLAQMFHRTHPDLFAIDFRMLIIKLMANFDFVANFRASKLELTRAVKKKGFVTLSTFMKAQKWPESTEPSVDRQEFTEFDFWTLHFGADAMHADGTFFFLARSDFIKNVGESFIDAFVTPFYGQEIRMQQLIIPLIDSPIIAFYTNKFLFNLIYRESRERAAHFLASMLEDWMTPGTKLYEWVTEYTELAFKTNSYKDSPTIPSERFPTYSHFRERLETILTRIKGYMPRAYMKVGRRTSTSSNSSDESVLSERRIKAPSSSGSSSSSSSSSSGPSSSSSSGPSSSSRSSFSPTRIPTPFQGPYERIDYRDLTIPSLSSTQNPFTFRSKSLNDNKGSSSRSSTYSHNTS